MPAVRRSKDETREKILAKAQDLFRRYGFSKTTVADIARELGMSPANIYKFFPAKGAIGEACAARGLEQVEREVSGIVESRGSAKDRIERVVLAIYHFNRRMLRNEREISKLVTAAIEGAWACVCNYRSFLHATMTRLIGEGMKSGEFSPGSPSRVADVLLDCLNAPLRAHLNPDYDPVKNQEKRIRAQIRFLFNALKFSK